MLVVPPSSVVFSDSRNYCYPYDALLYSVCCILYAARLGHGIHLSEDNSDAVVILENHFWHTRGSI